MPGRFRYPEDKINITDDFLEIRSYKYSPGDLFSGSGASNAFSVSSGGAAAGSLEYVIQLPIPESLPRISNSVDWGENTMGPVERAVLGLAGDPENIVENTKALVNDSLSTLNSTVGQNATSALIATAVAKATELGNASSANDILSRGRGIVFNGNLELLFKGVKLRQPVTFNFMMTPRKQTEGAMIKDIIFNLKRSMTPERRGATGGAGLFINAPNVFEIVYKTGNRDHPFLNKFKVCALADLSVDYCANGMYATYADGTPVNVLLSLTFAELTPIYKEDYDNQQGTGF